MGNKLDKASDAHAMYVLCNRGVHVGDRHFASMA